MAASAKHFPGHGDTDLDSAPRPAGGDHPRSRLRTWRSGRSARPCEAGRGHRHDGPRPRTPSWTTRCRPRSRRAIVQGLLREELELRRRRAHRRPRDEGRGRPLAPRPGRGAGPAGRLRRACPCATPTRPRWRPWRRRCGPWSRARSAGRTWTTPAGAIRRLKEQYLLPYARPRPQGGPARRGRRASSRRWPGRSRSRAERPSSTHGPPTDRRPRAAPLSWTRPAGRCGPGTSSACAPRAARSRPSRLERGRAPAGGAGLPGPRGRRRCGERTAFTAGTVERRAGRPAALLADHEVAGARLRARRRGRGLAAAAPGPRTACVRGPRCSWATAT